MVIMCRGRKAGQELFVPWGRSRVTADRRRLKAAVVHAGSKAATEYPRDQEGKRTATVHSLETQHCVKEGDRSYD